jgi:hypothetical protein
MNIADLKPGIIVRGPMLPEPVEILVVTPLGEVVKLTGAGQKTGQVHQRVLHAQQLALLEAHQAMLLFGSGRGEALKRFIVEEGIGKQPQFWKLAQSLSALYPSGTDEKRWVDGVLARKKGLGF